MREIKFRAWDEETKTMELYPYICCLGGGGVEIEFADDEGNYRPCPNAILMQYTGRKDKAGVEIYEGDITESVNPDFGFSYPDDEPKMVYYAVSWSKEHSAFQWGGMFLESDMDHCNVIGNIHQHQKLLEQE